MVCMYAFMSTVIVLVDGAMTGTGTGAVLGINSGMGAITGTGTGAVLGTNTGIGAMTGTGTGASTGLGTGCGPPPPLHFEALTAGCPPQFPALAYWQTMYQVVPPDHKVPAGHKVTAQPT